MEREDINNFIAEMINKHHFSRQELVQTMQEIQLQPEIITKISSPYEQKPWDVYKRLFLTNERLQEGLKFWQNNEQLLLKAEKQYQVPANIIVAILGVETLYGKKQGNYRVLDALATLAFDYPPRSAFFTKELREFLLLCREQNIPPTLYKGSYAGAIGKPQFMPSSYRYYAANFDAITKKDLVNDNAAVIASIANYFHQNHWQWQQQIAQPLTNFNRDTTTVNKINFQARKPLYTAKKLAKLGLLPPKFSRQANNLHNKLGLIALDTQKDPEFWLTYHNFYVITRYNSSFQYAMAVFLLAEQLKNNKTKDQINTNTIKELTPNNSIG